MPNVQCGCSEVLSSECAAIEFPRRSVQETWHEANGELVTG